MLYNSNNNEGVDDIQHLKNSQNSINEPIFNLDQFDFKEGINQLIKEGSKADNLGLNLVPIDIFPDTFKQLIQGCKDALNFPTDYTAAAILSAVSTAIGKSAKVKVKAGWFEYGSLFIGIIGNPGANKSHPLSLTFKPIEQADRVQSKIFNEAYEAYEIYMQLPAKDRANSEKVNMPKLAKTILNNFTPEALAKRLAENERGCVIVSDELATWIDNINNYSKGDQASTYLSTWSNKPTSIDRMKDPRPIFLENPYLNIIGTLQPRVLPKIFPSGKVDNGFLQRFLFAFPENAEKQAINDIEIDEILIDNYNQWIIDYRFFSAEIPTDPETDLPKPKHYYWSVEAKDFFYKWQAENTRLCNENAESIKGEVIIKYDIHFIRFALILQVMEDYQTDLISLNAVQGAAKLCAYFLHNSFKVLDILETSSPDVDLLPEVKQRFYDALPNEFTTGEAIKIGLALIPKQNEKAAKRFAATDTFIKVSHGHYRKPNF